METDVGIPVFQQILTELLDTNNDVRTGAEVSLCVDDHGICY